MEVFHDSNTNKSKNRINKIDNIDLINSTPNKGLSLIDAMAAAVGSLESNTIDNFGSNYKNNQANIGVNSEKNKNYKTSTVPILNNKTDSSISDDGDIFGIAYKPYRKKKKDYNTSTGPTFEDEKEFEKDLTNSEFINLSITHNINNSNENDIVLSPVIFVMPSSVNLRKTLYEPVTKKYIPQVGARIMKILYTD